MTVDLEINTIIKGEAVISGDEHHAGMQFLFGRCTVDLHERQGSDLLISW